MSWPPSVATINKYGLPLAVATVVPAAALTYMTSLEPISEKEQEWIDLEIAKRRAKLEEMIEFVETQLKEHAEHQGQSSRKPTEGSADDEDADEDETFDDDDMPITFDEMQSTCTECMQLEPDNKNLSQGFVLAGRLLNYELAKATKKTQEGDSMYRDGEQLDTLVRNHELWTKTIYKLNVSGSQWSDLKALENEIWPALRNAEKVTKSLRNSDFAKALRLVWMAKKSLPFIFASSGIASITGMLNGVECFYQSQVIEIFRKPGFEWSEYTATTKAIVVMRVFGIALTILRQRFDSWGREKLTEIIRNALYKALLCQDFEWYRLGQKNQRNMFEAFNVVFGVPYSVQNFLESPTELLTIATNIATQLAIVRQRSSRLLYAMMTIYWIKHFSARGVYWIQNRLREKLCGKVVAPDSDVWVEPVTPDNLPTVRSFAAESKALASFSVFFKSESRMDKQYELMDAAFSGVHAVVNDGGTIAERSFCGQLVKTGDVQTDTMTELMLSASQISNEINSTQHTIRSLNRSFAPLAKAWDMLTVQPNIGIEGGLTPDSPRAKGEIVFKDVKFKYPTGKQVLYGVSAAISTGKVCGITGTSGCGKSTLFALIERFYDTTGGDIFIDGYKIKDLNPTWLRRQISVVNQKPKFFNLPLRENLTYGCDATRSNEEIEEACKVANIHELVFHNKEKFPSGLHTHVSGANLSGGELQRLAIARAVLMDAPILLLDEATSALDSESQAAVNTALENLMKGKTVLSVAHRLEAIKDADMILCMHEGKVVEEGKHADLVARGGRYAELYKKQIEATSKAANENGNEDEDISPPVEINDADESTPKPLAVPAAAADRAKTQLAELRSLCNGLVAVAGEKQDTLRFAAAMKHWVQRFERGLVQGDGKDFLDFAEIPMKKASKKMHMNVTALVAAGRFKAHLSPKHKHGDAAKTFKSTK